MGRPKSSKPTKADMLLIEKNIKPAIIELRVNMGIIGAIGIEIDRYQEVWVSGKTEQGIKRKSLVKRIRTPKRREGEQHGDYLMRITEHQREQWFKLRTLFDLVTEGNQ